MEKLLHERLREWIPESSSSCVRDMVNGRETFVDDCTYDCPACASNAAKKLADEIERFYIPRPRFEDGEPVQFGDNIANDHFELGSPVDAFEIRENGFINIYGNGNSIEFADFEPVQHPTPKVYDADGVEIKVGDTVYETSRDEPLTVCEVNSQYVHARTGSGGIRGNLTACYLTHERPVFDADGVRICKGDTVWVKDAGFNAWTVTRVKDSYISVCDAGNTETEIFEPESLTHREPDSLEKLRDDMNTFVAAKHPASSETLGGYCDRLTALIESGA